MPATPLGMVWEDFAISTCTGNKGDPIVLYDRFEDCWILEQLTTGCLDTADGNCYTCVAVWGPHRVILLICIQSSTRSK